MRACGVRVGVRAVAKLMTGGIINARGVPSSLGGNNKNEREKSQDLELSSIGPQHIAAGKS